jgi:hypothetical protein
MFKLHWKLFFSAKTRGIAIPVDLDSQVSIMFEKAQIVAKQAKQWMQKDESFKIYNIYNTN